MEFYDGAVSHVFAAAPHKNAYHAGAAVMVEATTLDLLLKNTGPLVLKIDVEGHEPEVLRGATRLLAAGLVRAVVLDADKEARVAANVLGTLGFDLIDPKSFQPVSEFTGVFLALKRVEGGGLRDPWVADNHGDVGG